MNLDRIRNLSIVAHVDHGKSTLSDRILELTGAVDARDMREQYLDSMDIERERGITIKAQNVRVHWKGHTIHLIDTPGHVDFGYEVSRSLAACEGVVLLVDAAQGIEAQTLANAYQALEHDLEIVAALNKIDLPAADPDRYADEIERVLGVPADQILRMSAKTGRGRAGAARRHLRSHPAADGRPRRAPAGPASSTPTTTSTGAWSAPSGSSTAPWSRAPACGSCRPAGPTTSRRSACAPRSTSPVAALGPGEVGYLIAGIKDVGEARSGETVTDAARPGAEAAGGLPGPQAHGVLRAVPHRRRRLRQPAGGPREAPAQRRLRSPTSPRRRARSGSASAAGSSGCCTWRSSGSASSGSSTCRSSPPRRASSTGPT